MNTNASNPQRHSVRRFSVSPFVPGNETTAIFGFFGLDYIVDGLALLPEADARGFGQLLNDFCQLLSSFLIHRRHIQANDVPVIDRIDPKICLLERPLNVAEYGPLPGLDLNSPS